MKKVQNCIEPNQIESYYFSSVWTLKNKSQIKKSYLVGFVFLVRRHASSSLEIQLIVKLELSSRFIRRVSLCSSGFAPFIKVQLKYTIQIRRDNRTVRLESMVLRGTTMAVAVEAGVGLNVKGRGYNVGCCLTLFGNDFLMNG